MRYKYKIYKNNEKIIVNTSKFSIEFYFNRLKAIDFDKKIRIIDEDFVELSEIDLLFDNNIKETLLEGIQRTLFYYENCKFTGKQLGIYFFSSFTMKEDNRKRIYSIFNEIENKINKEKIQYFKLDFKNKEFALKMMKYDSSNFSKIDDNLKYDKDILDILFKEYKCDPDFLKVIQKDYDILIQFINGNNHNSFSIKEDFVTDEVIDLLFQTEYLIERKM